MSANKSIVGAEKVSVGCTNDGPKKSWLAALAKPDVCGRKGKGHVPVCWVPEDPPDSKMSNKLLEFADAREMELLSKDPRLPEDTDFWKEEINTHHSLVKMNGKHEQSNVTNSIETK